MDVDLNQLHNFIVRDNLMGANGAAHEELLTESLMRASAADPAFAQKMEFLQGMDVSFQVTQADMAAPLVLDGMTGSDYLLVINQNALQSGINPIDNILNGIEASYANTFTAHAQGQFLDYMSVDAMRQDLFIYDRARELTGDGPSTDAASYTRRMVEMFDTLQANPGIVPGFNQETAMSRLHAGIFDSYPSKGEAYLSELEQAIDTYAGTITPPQPASAGPQLMAP